MEKINNSILFLFLAFPSLAWIGLGVSPIGYRWVFVVTMIIGSLMTVLFYWKTSAKLNTNKKNIYKRGIERYILSMIIFLLFLISVFVYSNRWMVEPHGMDDAKVLWSLKSYSIYYDFFFNESIDLYNKNWKHLSYPIGYPLLLSSMSIILGEWTNSTIYTIPILMTGFLLFTLGMEALKFRLKPLKLVLILLWIFYWFTNVFFLFLQSDLCADYPIVFGLSIFLIGYYQKNNNISAILLMLISLIFVASMKNEGLILFFIGITYLFYLLYRSKDQKLIIAFGVVFVFFFSYIPYYKWNVGLLSQDFHTESNTSLTNVILSRILKPEFYQLMTSYFFEYHIDVLKSFSLVSIVFILLFQRNRKVLGILGIYIFLSLFYNAIYIATFLDLDSHLKTSYNRIHFQLTPLLFFSVFYTIQHPNIQKFSLIKRLLELKISLFEKYKKRVKI